MKNLLINLLFLLSFATVSFATANPGELFKLLDNRNVTITLSNADQINVFNTVAFNVQDDNLEFETENDISFVQIFNKSGDLEFQLLVDSNKVKIGKSLFGEEDYKIGFLIEGEENIQFTDVRFK